MTVVFNLVNGSSWTGAKSAAGATNAVSVNGSTWVTRNHKCGAINVYIDTDGSGLFGCNHKSGALRVVSGVSSSSGAVAGSGLS